MTTAGWLVEMVASRPDCTIYHLLDLADVEIVREYLGSPEADGELWQDGGAIRIKFKSLPLQEQIEAARYTLKAYQREIDVRHAIGWCIEWLTVPDNTQCHQLILILGKDAGPSVPQAEAFLSALELLAKKEGLWGN